MLFRSELTRVINDTWRTQEDAIIIGGETARTDNPHLTVRSIEGRNPKRIVISESGDLPNNLNLLDGNASTIVYSKNKINHTDCDSVLIPEESDLHFILSDLYQRTIQSVIVEGGATLLNQFIGTDLWDEIRIFESENLLEDGILAPTINLEITSTEQIGDNILKTIHRRK